MTDPFSPGPQDPYDVSKPYQGTPFGDSQQYPAPARYPSTPQYPNAPQYPVAQPSGYPQPYGAAQPVVGPPMYAFSDPQAPYGRDPITGQALSDKSKVAAGLLQLLLSFVCICGVGRLYLGSVGIGLFQLLGMFFALVMSPLVIGIPFVVAIWIWTVIDGIMILSGSVRDKYGRPLN